jgi:hypothetical protein
MQRRQIRDLVCGTAVSGLVLLSGCSSSSSPSTSSGTLSNVLTVPGISSTVTYSFDLGVYDSATGKYYVTDRTNKSIDVVDVNNGLAVTQFKPAGLTGCGGAEVVSPGAVPVQNTPIPTCSNTAAGIFPSFTVNNDQSGPDGLDIVGNTLFVGDVNKLLVLNKATGALIATIAIASTPTGLRADEGCFDPVNHLYAISTPGDNNPFMTLLDTTNAEANPPTAPTVKARLIMDNPAGTASGGLEACVFDTGPGTTNKLYVNNDGNNNGGAPAGASRGEMDGIPVTSLTPLVGGGNVQYTTLAGITQWVLPDVAGVAGQCDPTGIAVGPGSDIGAMCRTGTIGRSLNFLILNKTTGAVAATVVGAGGGDQITYDAGSGNWFLGTSRATASGNSCGAGSAACPLTPMVTIVNGASRAMTGRVPAGNNSHSVATGGGLVFSPFTNLNANGGGVGFPNGGIAVFYTH